MSSLWASLAALVRSCPLAFVIATFILPGGTAIAEQVTFKTEFVDMMRWEHLNRTRPLYLPSTEWAEHCSLFVGIEWKAKCEEKHQDVLDGEHEATTLLYKLGLESTVRKRGWIALHLPKNLKNQEVHNDFDIAWIETLDKLIAGYRSPESDNCMQEYACSVLFNFDCESLSLKGVQLVVHSEVRSN